MRRAPPPSPRPSLLPSVPAPRRPERGELPQLAFVWPSRDALQCGSRCECDGLRDVVEPGTTRAQGPRQRLAAAAREKLVRLAPELRDRRMAPQMEHAGRRPEPGLHTLRGSSQPQL